MPRTLPWLDGNQTSSTTSRATPQRTTKRRRVDDSSSSNEPQQAKLKFERDDATGIRTRHSSSSPPLSQPLPQEYVREGLSADDEWMMVEDEFLATAQQYTRHLHRAEYQRQQKLARSRVQEPTNCLHNILNGGAIKRWTASESEVKQENGSVNRGIKSKEEDGPDSWKNDVRLAGLMDGRSQHHRLVATARPVQTKAKASTKVLEREGEEPGSSPPELLDTVSGPINEAQRYVSSTRLKAKPAPVAKGNESGPSRIHQTIDEDYTNPKSALVTGKSNTLSNTLKPVRDIDPFVMAGSNRQRIESEAATRRVVDTTPKPTSRTAIDWDALDKPISRVDDTTKRTPSKLKPKPTTKTVSLDEIPTFLV